MIVTVTVNPSIDRTLEIEDLVPGVVHRADRPRVEAGGKGVNIARALAANGRKVRAVLPTGGPDGKLLADLLGAARIDFIGVPIAEPVRTNVSVVDARGVVTKFNAPGPRLSAIEVDALVETALEVGGGARWAVCGGSLPPGAPHDLYARLVQALRTAGCAVALDSSGPPLLHGLAAGPDVIKPNAEELAEAVGRPIPTLGAAVDAAEELRQRGAKAVLASLGADGAVLVEGGDAVHGRARVDVVRSAVGSGDATLAGFIASGGTGREALAAALAWGAAAVQLPGSRMPAPRDLRPDLVHLSRELEASRHLASASR